LPLGAGYIGSHACKALAAIGFVPIAYDNLSRGNRWAVKWGPLEEGDIADGGRVRAVLEKYRPAALMHFAAYAYVGESVERPLLYCETPSSFPFEVRCAILARRATNLIAGERTCKKAKWNALFYRYSHL
jgi:UDP-glucose 4-epimerase